ncbi:MAG TPA: peptidoglycan-associated lipoprotein Pal [Caulobacterales bacterium]|nr:peptidoglycan-associated lipoprotein Pal [Caulobacterales bacterium]
MRNSLPLAAALATLAAVSACATKKPVDTTPPTTAVSPTPQGPVPGSLADFQASVSDRVYFDYDQYTLRPDARATLEKQAAWLAKYPAVRVTIEGNADERGTREYTLALGARRAASTKDYLVSLGVAPSRIETVSFGKERPIDPRSNEQAWALNRNSHTQITSGAVS